MRTGNVWQTTRTLTIHAVAVVVALVAFAGVSAASGGSTGTEHTLLDGVELLQVGQEYCDTEGGGLLESGVGFAAVFFFVVILIAAFIASSLEALPLTGWFNQVSFMMMGKIPIAIFFLFMVITLITVVSGTYGIEPPTCIPIIG